MTLEDVEKIFEDTESDWESDNAFQGLKILEKYANGDDVICAAEHDIIYSIDIEKLLNMDLLKKIALPWQN